MKVKENFELLTLNFYWIIFFNSPNKYDNWKNITEIGIFIFTAAMQIMPYLPGTFALHIQYD